MVGILGHLSGHLCATRCKDKSRRCVGKRNFGFPVPRPIHRLASAKNLNGSTPSLGGAIENSIAYGSGSRRSMSPLSARPPSTTPAVRPGYTPTSTLDPRGISDKCRATSGDGGGGEGESPPDGQPLLSARSAVAAVAAVAAATVSASTAVGLAMPPGSRPIGPALNAVDVDDPGCSRVSSMVVVLQGVVVLVVPFVSSTSLAVAALPCDRLPPSLLSMPLSPTHPLPRASFPVVAAGAAPPPECDASGMLLPLSLLLLLLLTLPKRFVVAEHE